MRFPTRILLCLIAVVALAGCQNDEPLDNERALGPVPGADLKAALPPTYCSTTACVQDFMDDLPCDGGYSRADLIVDMSGSPYVLSDHQILDECAPPFPPTEVNWWGFLGASATDRPTITVPGSPDYYGPISAHACLHAVENLDPAKPNLVKDIILDVNSRMGGGIVPGIQFEACSLHIENAEFRGPGTTHFLAPFALSFDGLTIAAGHEFVIGDNLWCGDTAAGFCDGPPAVLPNSGALITNSALFGDFEIDCAAGPATAHTITFSNNDPLTKLELDIDLNGGTIRPVIMLTENTFADAAGAKVVIAGDYEVVAEGNETFQGPDFSDALLDFDTSGVTAGNLNPLTLVSYVYDGVTYDSNEILSAEIFVQGGTCNTAYVRFVTRGTGATGSVNWGASGCTNTVAATTIGDTHYASFDITGLTGVYWRAESDVGGNTDATSCVLQKRPKRGIFGCPPPPWWPY